jgi:hypothetical protein
MSKPQAHPSIVAVFTVAIAIALGLIAVAWQGAAAAFWAAACVVAGGTVGFLFGIHRTLQGDQLTPHPQEGNGRAYEQRVNTNLEQISDWLTKMLVGLGLTQLGTAPDRLREAATFMASGMADPKSAVVFASATIVYFSIVGFIGGYLVTRLFLAGAFREADVGGLERRMGEVQIETLAESALQDLDRAARAATLYEDIRALKPYRKEFPANRRLHIVLNRLYAAVGERDKAIEVLDSFIKEKRRQGEGQDQDTADALFNLACDYALRSAEVTGADKEKVQKLALDRLRQSVLLSPANAQDAASPTESDLDPIRELPEFRKIVGG